MNSQSKQFDLLSGHANDEPGLTIQADPRGVTFDGLVELRKWSNVFSRNCPALGEWLKTTIMREAERRDSETTPDPLEHPLPVIPAHNFSNRDLGQSLQHLVLSEWVAHDETAQRFIRKITLAVLVCVRERLNSKD